MKTLSVNEVLKLDHASTGTLFEVEGILEFGQDSRCLKHWPKSKRFEGGESSIWIDAQGVFEFDDATLARWSGKRVVVFGEYESVEPLRDGVIFDGETDGFGSWGLWESRMLVRRIELLKYRNRIRGDG